MLAEPRTGNTPWEGYGKVTTWPHLPRTGLFLELGTKKVLAVESLTYTLWSLCVCVHMEARDPPLGIMPLALDHHGYFF